MKQLNFTNEKLCDIVKVNIDYKFTEFTEFAEFIEFTENRHNDQTAQCKRF